MPLYISLAQVVCVETFSHHDAGYLVPFAHLLVSIDVLLRLNFNTSLPGSVCYVCLVPRKLKYSFTSGNSKCNGNKKNKSDF